MLQNLREHTQGWIASVIATVLCLAFALWGIQYYLGGGHNGSVVAKVNGEDITPNQYNSAYKLLRQRLHLGLESSASMDQALQVHLKAAALQEIISQYVLFDAATHDGFMIGNNQIGAIIAQVPAFQINGQFAPALFQRFIQEYYSSESEFLLDLKQKATVVQAKSGIAASAFALPNEINQALTLTGQKRDLVWATIPASQFLQTAKVSDADIQAYYQTHKLEFMTPEQIKIQYLELSGVQANKKISLTDQEIQQYYQDNEASFSSPDQLQAAHIVINVPENADQKSISATQTKINFIAQQIQAGQDFARLALQYSDDKATAISGGVMGWVNRAQLSPAMLQAIATLSPGQVSAPFRTTQGFELVKLLAVKKGEPKPLAEVRPEVENNLRRQKGEQLLADLSDQLSNLTYTNPDTLKVAADALGLPIQTSELFTRKGGSTGLIANPKVVNAAFSENVLKQSNNSDVINIDSQTQVVLRVAEHKPSVVRPLADVRDSIEKLLMAEQAKKAAKLSGDKIIAELEGGAAKEQVATQHNLTWTQKVEVGREATDVPADILKLAFSLPPLAAGKPSIGGKSLVNGDYIVVVLSKIEPGIPSKVDSKQRELQQQSIAMRQGMLDYYLYTAQHMRTAKIKYEEKP